MIKFDTYDYNTIDEKIREEVRGLGDEFRKLEQSSTKLAIDAGFKLRALKERLPHGQFLPYCKEALHTEKRKAQLQMRLACLTEAIARDRLELLPVTIAYKLAAPEVSESLIHEIITDFDGGLVLTVEIVLTRIKEGKKNSSPRPDVEDAEIDKIHAMLSTALEEAEITQLVAFLTQARTKSIRELSGRLVSSIAGRKRPPAMSLPAAFG
jgi:hypothetical protein